MCGLRHRLPTVMTEVLMEAKETLVLASHPCDTNFCMLF